MIYAVLQCVAVLMAHGAGCDVYDVVNPAVAQSQHVSAREFCIREAALYQSAVVRNRATDRLRFVCVGRETGEWTEVTEPKAAVPPLPAPPPITYRSGLTGPVPRALGTDYGTIRRSLDLEGIAR